MATVQSAPPTQQLPGTTPGSPARPTADLSKYFGRKPREEIAKAVQDKIDDYIKWLKQTGRLYLYRRSFDYYYRGLAKGGRLWKSGQQDEYMNVSVNHFRNIILHILSGAASQRPTFNPVAINSDYKSQAQTKVSRGVLDYYNREKKVETFLKKAGETALIYSLGFVTLDWDTELGEDYAVGPTGEKIKEGDISIACHSPLTMAYDYTLEDAAHSDWYVARRIKNKYAIAAKYPQFADKILAQEIEPNDIIDRAVIGNFANFDDMIFVDTLYHRKTAVVPDGRLVEVIGNEIVTIDTPLPYKTLPVYRIAPEDVNGSASGYTIAFDLLPIQEICDKLYSTILTNQGNFGIQNIWTQPGGGISVTELAGGMNHIQSPSKPEVVQLLQTPQEVFSFLEKTEKVMEVISGVNSVSRGNPESSLKSGSALALVASQAIQFNSNFQQSYNRLLEDVGTGIIEMLARFAKTKRMIAISGKANAGYMTEFSAADLSNISRVQVEMGNPLSRTTAGKLQIAESLLNAQQIKTPQEYIQVLMTGNIDPLVEGDQAQLLLIRAENEALSKGQTAPALITDAHQLHIREHGVVLASPASRSNPTIVQAALAHIQEHLNLMRMGDPAVLTINGEQPIPTAVPGMIPAPMTAAVAGAPQGVPQAMNAENPLTQEAEEVRMPSMPKNPLTGVRQ